MKKHIERRAIETIWCAPDQDSQYTTKLARLSGTIGYISRMTLLREEVNLPTRDDFYHVFQMGFIHNKTIGLLGLQNGWNKLSDVINRSNLFASVFFIDGRVIPSDMIWIHYSHSRNLTMAILDDESFISLRSVDPYFRVYTNAYYSSDEYDGLYSTEVHGYKSTGSQSVLDLQARYHNYLSNRPGSAIAYHNGYPVSDLNPGMIRIGDWIEFVYDPTIYRVVSYSLSELHTFLSIRDNKRKYLLNYESLPGFDSERIDYKDDVDVYIFNKTNNVKKGLYYPQLLDDSLRMVTHKDYSIPELYIRPFINNNTNIFNGDSDVDIRIYVRKGGLNRKLIHEGNRIHELYKLPNDKILEAMLGINSNVLAWKAEQLENSAYVRIMSEPKMLLNTYMVHDAFGYNAISRMLGDSPIEVVDNQLKLLPAQAKDCAVYEYDSNGHFLSANNNEESSFYVPVNPNTKLAEVIVGQYSDAREIFYQTSDVVVEPGFAYRVYLCTNLPNGPKYNWVDITDTGAVSVHEGVLHVEFNPVTEYVAVISDKRHVHYTVNVLPFKGVYRFSLEENDNEFDVPGKHPSRIPCAGVTVWVKGADGKNRVLNSGLDYVIKWPEIWITNKEWLSNEPEQEFSVRFGGFCGPEMRLLDLDQQGFVEHGYLSANDRYDITEDRVLSVYVDGCLRKRDTVNFADVGTGASVTSSRNGAPYTVRETFVNFRGGLEMDAYNMRAISRVVDRDVSNYMTEKYPQPQVSGISPIVQRHTLYSLFTSTLLFACRNNDIDNEVIKGHYGDNIIRQLVAPYLDVLAIDPAHTGFDESYCFVEPFPKRGIEEVDIYHHNFIARAINLYLQGKVNLSQHVNILVQQIEV